MMTSMRGGFRSAVKGVTGQGKGGRPPSPARHLLMNLLTLGLAIAAAVLLLRRFGVLG
jgi:hypothetical protein